ELDLYVERLFLVRKAMEALPAENKALLSLRYETGMSIKEIADLFNLSDDAVKMRLKRSRDRIKQLALHG
ncbi:MAG: sigma-70 family RNA polymerase sigma factor, partial [Spirosoma sp.]